MPSSSYAGTIGRPSTIIIFESITNGHQRRLLCPHSNLTRRVIGHLYVDSATEPIGYEADLKLLCETPSVSYLSLQHAAEFNLVTSHPQLGEDNILQYRLIGCRVKPACDPAQTDIIKEELHRRAKPPLSLDVVPTRRRDQKRILQLFQIATNGIDRHSRAFLWITLRPVSDQ